ncbi:hypothetical protein [Methylobacterium persicinum]|uniref:Uncharacterized protein n=1 Tax=Methylobacterium persicinum TaxID=374426 RepID=A0ABU0HNC5_9HYPH|nr:hypothetical protein [Methylobacterium persicinum]MDQ0443338.1 hypothetical protein [Methylobacterium persicinum]GJE37671.1 hypothetical protein KHHGKMAE_1732 [Methylobacterium persicinum]
MEWIYRGFETSLLALSLGLGLAALASLGPPREPEASLAVTLPMISVTASQ